MSLLEEAKNISITSDVEFSVDHYVVSIENDCVVYAGSYSDCSYVLESNAGGLAIFNYEDLTPGMVKSIDMLGVE